MFIYAYIACITTIDVVGLLPCIKIKRLIYITLGLIFLTSCQSKTDTAGFQNGDIIFQTSTSGQSKAIQIATGSKYSHMGIIYKQGEDMEIIFRKKNW